MSLIGKRSTFPVLNSPVPVKGRLSVEGCKSHEDIECLLLPPSELDSGELDRQQALTHTVWHGSAVCTMLSCSVMSNFATTWTVVHQAPLFVGSSRQEYWSGVLFPPLGDPLDSGIASASPAAPALAGGFLITEPAGKPHSKRWLR